MFNPESRPGNGSNKMNGMQRRITWRAICTAAHFLQEYFQQELIAGDAISRIETERLFLALSR